MTLILLKRVLSMASATLKQLTMVKAVTVANPLSGMLHNI